MHTYSSLFTKPTLKVAALDLGEESFGYAVYNTYLRDELEGKDFKAFLVDRDLNKGSLPYEFYGFVSKNDPTDGPFDLLINLPLHCVNEKVTSEVHNLILDSKNTGGITAGILHDITLAQNYTWHQKPVFRWNGAYYAEVRKRMVEDFRYLAARLDYLIAPSSYVQDVFRQAFPEYREKIIIIPNPYLKTLEKKGVWTGKKKGRVLLINSLYKQRFSDLLMRLRQEPVFDRILLLNSDMLDNEHHKHAFAEILDFKNLEIVYDTSHANILDLLKFQVTHFIDVGALPESFGYMPREARFFGCKLILDGRGALGEIV